MEHTGMNEAPVSLRLHKESAYPNQDDPRITGGQRDPRPPEVSLDWSSEKDSVLLRLQSGFSSVMIVEKIPL